MILIACPLPESRRGPRTTVPTIRHLIVGVLIFAKRIFTRLDATQVCPGLSIVHSCRGTAFSSALASSPSGALTGIAMTDVCGGTAIRVVDRGGATRGTFEDRDQNRAARPPAMTTRSSRAIARRMVMVTS